MVKKAFYETSILFEPFTKKTRFGGVRYGQNAMAILKGVSPLNKKFKSVVSASVIGECELVLNNTRISKRYNRSIDEVRKLQQEFIEKCEMVPITSEAIHLASTIISEDGQNKLTPSDVLNFCCAICSGCDFFFFIDKELRNNDIIKRHAKENNISLAPFDIEKNQDK